MTINPKELEQMPSHPSFIQPLLDQGEASEDGRKLLRKIKQDPEWKKRVEKMLNFELHTLKGRLSWEQDKLKEQKKYELISLISYYCVFIYVSVDG